MTNTPLTRAQAMELLERIRTEHQRAMDLAIRSLWFESGRAQAHVGMALERLIEHFETTGQ